MNDPAVLTLIVVGTHAAAVALGYLFAARRGAGGDTINLTVETSQTVTTPDPWAPTAATTTIRTPPTTGSGARTTRWGRPADPTGSRTTWDGGRRPCC